MLVSHPKQRWIFAASREDDAILTLTKLMTLLPTHQRQRLLRRVDRHLERLRAINNKHFDASPFIDSAINDLESGCRHIASLQSTESRLDGLGTCPVCSSAISDLPDHADMTYCGTCLNTIQDARLRLETEEGFSTGAI